MNAKTKLKPEINRKWCKNCGLCVAFCPEEVFVNDNLGRPLISHPEKCSACKRCFLRCPDIAISMVSSE